MNPSTLAYPNQAAEDRVEVWITDHIRRFKIENKPAWRIKWRGELIKTVSGKSSWRTIGHAKTAFRHHICRCELAYLYQRNLMGDDKLTRYDPHLSDEAFYKIIEHEVEYVQG